MTRCPWLSTSQIVSPSPGTARSVTAPRPVASSGLRSIVRSGRPEPSSRITRALPVSAIHTRPRPSVATPTGRERVRPSASLTMLVRPDAGSIIAMRSLAPSATYSCPSPLTVTSVGMRSGESAITGIVESSVTTSLATCADAAVALKVIAAATYAATTPARADSERTERLRRANITASVPRRWAQGWHLGLRSCFDCRLRRSRRADRQTRACRTAGHPECARSCAPLPGT